MNRRILQLAEVIKRVLVHYTQTHPLCSASGQTFFVTVTQVRLSGDYAWADVFVSLLYGKDSSYEAFWETLQDRASAMRHYVAQNAGLKRTPQLRFIYDDSFDRAMRTESLLNSSAYTKQ